MKRAIGLLLAINIVAGGAAAETQPVPGPADKQFVRYSAPRLLSYEELVKLSDLAEPRGALGAELERLLATPFISNEAYYNGAKPRRPHDPRLGPFLRACLWNIERGIRLDEIKLAFTSIKMLERRLSAAGLKPDELRRALDEARALQQADVIVLNEADLGMRRSEYRDVTRELARALNMNYAYGVEFVEVDPVNLGMERFEEVPSPEREELQREIAVDPTLYRGLHGSAVLSRYPVRSARIVRFKAQPHNWYLDEKKQVSPVELGKRKLSEKVFLEKVLREIRHGGRMMLIAELEVPDLPGRTLTVVAAHLESKCKPEGRQAQMRELLAHIGHIKNPLILAGDMNTSGRDQTPTSARREIMKRLGSREFWMKQGLKYATGIGLMLDFVIGGVGLARSQTDPTVRDVFLVSPNPESKLFDLVEAMRFADGYCFDFRGDPRRTVNGNSGTLANSNQRASKGFESTYELERTFGPMGEFKLDWFFVKPFLKSPRDKNGSYRFAPHFGRTLKALNYSFPDRLSDHNPMLVDLPFGEPKIKGGEGEGGLFGKFKKIF